MKFESVSVAASEEAISHFFSEDPYEVLGISRNATRDEMKEARNNLQRKFYADISEHPRALEITQKINVAYDKVVGRGKTFTSEPERPTQGDEALKKEVIDSLRLYDINGFRRVIMHAEKNGLSKADIELILRGELVQVEIVKTLLSKVGIYWDDPGTVEIFVNNWKSVGIDMWKCMKSDGLKDVLEEKLIEYKIGIFNDPKSFIKIINAWKEMGVDLGDVINKPAASKKLEEVLVSKRAIFGIAYIQQSLQSWIQVGWNPGQEILDLLNQT